jgi:GT2 family glycosyltransferase
VLDRLTVVALNWETPDLTLRCVRALVGDGVPPGRIVVVDNGSSDDSVERFRAELPDSVVLALPENVGYARAANAGARELPGDAYLVTNNDAFVHRPGSVRAMVEALTRETVGFVVPRLRNEDLTLQPTVRPLPTAGVSVLRATGLGRLVPNRWQPAWSHHWDHAGSREIIAADGAVVLLDAETWDRLGGRKVWFCAEAEFVHLGNATGSRRWTNPERATMIGREESKLLFEQLSRPGAAVAIAATSLYHTWRAAAFVLQGDRTAAAATRAARSAYLQGLRAGVSRAS